MKTYKAIGLMSGTSMDGIDAAIIVTDGYKVIQTLADIMVPYSEEFRDKLNHIAQNPEDKNKDAIEKELTILHAQAVEKLLNESR